MLQSRDFRRFRFDTEFRQKRVIVHFVNIGLSGGNLIAKQALMIERFDQRAALFQRTDTIQPNGIKPLENVAVFAVAWRAAMFFDKALNFFKACDNPLFARRAAARFLGFDLDP
ncbi:hypothetical protein GCM10011491_42210 [Brucella endophytica]|uniref:Uncharacterized protein n=1 Tax=Brucella endophytica TaxID=1963359 RepID=A0A916WLM8_9HYPH|nr:hypothetical protein GCM10011491_42210 [Brucella endophytica]